MMIMPSWGFKKQKPLLLGDIISFQLPSWAETVVIHRVLAIIGIVSNPISLIYCSKEIKYMLN
jgi:hypothetical protein